MEQLTTQEKSQLKAVIRSPQWRIVERVAEMMCVKVKENVPIRDSEWETLREVLQQEGQIQGIRKLMQELFLQAAEES